MNDWELIFTMLGEKATTDITQVKDAQGFDECKETANVGGNIAKRAREDLERNLGRSVVSEDKFLDRTEKKVLEDRPKPKITEVIGLGKDIMSEQEKKELRETVKSVRRGWRKRH